MYSKEKKVLKSYGRGGGTELEREKKDLEAWVCQKIIQF